MIAIILATRGALRYVACLLQHTTFLVNSNAPCTMSLPYRRDSSEAWMTQAS